MTKMYKHTFLFVKGTDARRAKTSGEFPGHWVLELPIQTWQTPDNRGVQARFGEVKTSEGCWPT